MLRLGGLLLLSWAISLVTGSPLTAADAIAALLPLAAEYGLSEWANTASAVALTGMAPLAWALHSYLHYRIFAAQQANVARRGKPNRAERLYQRSGHNRRLQQLDWEVQVLQAITPFEFRNLYGLQFEPFMDLLDIIREDIVNTPGGWGGVRSSAILPPEVKLAMTLRFLRGWLVPRLENALRRFEIDLSQACGRGQSMLVTFFTYGILKVPSIARL